MQGRRNESSEPVLSGALPTRFPIFPLPGAILLPSGNLPLNIFEPRYRQMTRDAMRTDRVIGMVQPHGGSSDRSGLFAVGCAGRITSFAETEDGRYLITLTGICRYDVVEELRVSTPYRQCARASNAGRRISSRQLPPSACGPSCSTRCAVISRCTRSAPTGTRSAPHRSAAWSPRSP